MAGSIEEGNGHPIQATAVSLERGRRRYLVSRNRVAVAQEAKDDAKRVDQAPGKKQSILDM